MSETAPAIVRRTITAEHKFTDAERLEIAAQLAEKISEKGRLEESKKNLTSQMKSEIDAAETEIELLSQKINTGKEFRDFFCRVEFDYDAKVKNYYDDLTGLFIKKEAMTAHDLQTKLALDEEAKEAEEESKPAETHEEINLTAALETKYHTALFSCITDMHDEGELILGAPVPMDDTESFDEDLLLQEDSANELASAIIEAFANVEVDAEDFLSITGAPIGEFHRRLMHGSSIGYALKLLVNDEGLLKAPTLLDLFFPNASDKYAEFESDVVLVIQALAEVDTTGDEVEAAIEAQSTPEEVLEDASTKEDADVPVSEGVPY